MTLQPKPICIVKDCGKVGIYRLIHSYKEEYGWFCKVHQRELYEINYPDLLGEGYNITITNNGYCMTACWYCAHCDPCGNCGYVKVNNERWYFQSLHERKIFPPRFRMGLDEAVKEQMK
jgi:hypothetical protein